jgi:hypothetical protein
MAKITGPLMSFAAAGTIAGLLTFRAELGKTIATRQRAAATTPTTRQLAARQRAAWAADSWRDVSQTSRDQWQTRATAARLPIFGLYLREFMTQQCGPGDQPMVPA